MSASVSKMIIFLFIGFFLKSNFKNRISFRRHDTIMFFTAYLANPSLFIIYSNIFMRSNLFMTFIFIIMIWFDLICIILQIINADLFMCTFYYFNRWFIAIHKGWRLLYAVSIIFYFFIWITVYYRYFFWFLIFLILLMPLLISS